MYVDTLWNNGFLDWRTHSTPPKWRSLNRLADRLGLAMGEHQAGRIAELDAVRGMAAISVVVYHYSYPSTLYDKYFYVAGSAMELFFVLSGYLITSIILRQGRNAGFLKSFYVRRILRIWPIYYFMIVAGALLVAWRPELGKSSQLPQYLTFSQNVELYWGSSNPPLMYPVLHTWSLAVEEQFYLIWPLLLLLSGTRRLPLIAAVCVVLGLACRASGYPNLLLVTRCDNFAIGALLAALLSSDRVVDKHLWTVIGLSVAAAAAAILMFCRKVSGFEPAELTLSSIFFASLLGIIVMNSGSIILAPLRIPLLCYIGKISYGVYLYHLAAIVIASGIARHLGLSPLITATITAPLLCLAVAAAS